MQLIDGKKIAGEIKLEIAAEVEQLVSSGKKRPHLAAILVGHANKVKSCAEVGFESTLIRFEENVSEKELLDKVNELNNNSEIDGFIVQLPLPKHISENKVIETIDYRKDVDGFHPTNTGRLLKGMPCFISATPYGIMELLKRYNIETSGKHCRTSGQYFIIA
jgi:methylenetetrahydrofolate dehydrogenase (NADP+)/methenyltetrahydrofolate cyclohydrolase